MAEHPTQTGALPWRRSKDGRLEVLLVTTRRSRRWLIPKGWPMPGRSLAEAAAQEAFEEAGVEGTIENEPLGWLTHDKQHVMLGAIKTRIAVHRLAVERELAHWPEIGQRKRRWFSLEQAVEQVDSPDLARMIQRLNTDANPLKDGPDGGGGPTIELKASGGGTSE